MADTRLTPYDWQQADITKITRSLSPEVGALVVSAPGAGKTLVGVEAIRNLRPEVTLIIAPPSTHFGSWLRTLKRQGVADRIRTLIGTEPGKRAWADLRWGVPGVYVTSAQWFARQDWGSITPDMVIFDEIHMVAKHGNVSQQKLIGANKKKGLYAPYRIALSGTPFRNNFENAWTIARWVEPRKMPKEYWVWRVTECVGKYDHFAPQNLKVTGERVPGQLASSLTCYVAHYQRERCCKFHPKGFLAHLAPPIRIERDLAMTKAQAEFYHGMEKSYVAFLTTPGEDGKVPVVAEFPITARGMLRFCALGLPSYDSDAEKLFFDPKCESPKLDAVATDLAALDGKRALILTHSAQFAEVAAGRLTEQGFRVALWRGKVSAKRRGEILSDFISGELDAIVGVISAMGTGTDGLQEAAYNVMWLSVDDDPSNVVQGIGRLDRLGQTHQVTMIEYRMLKTYDVGHLDQQIEKQLDLNKSLRVNA
jgi:hypothetical protein